MLKRGSSEIVTAVEIGTSKIGVIIGEADENGNIIVLGHGERASDDCIFKGEIVDMQKTLPLFYEALADAEEAAGTEVEPHNVYVGVTGYHITPHQGVGSVPISNDDRRITETHIQDALQNAAVVSHSSDEIIIDAIGGHFIIDGKRQSNKPLDQVAHKLESHSHIICGNRNQVENFLTPLKDAHIDHPKAVFTGLASAVSVISDEEHRQGVLFIDIGAGTTEYILFYDPGIHESGVIAVGCDHIVNDLSIALELPFAPTCRNLLLSTEKKENIKDGYIEVLGALGTRQIPVDTIEKVINMRLNELFSIIHERLNKRGLLNTVGSGIVLTGGGAELGAVKEIVSSIFSIPVRISRGDLPDHFGGTVTELRSPRYSMILGLLEFGIQRSSKGSLIAKLDRNVNMGLRSAWKKTVRAFRI
jgi:cell division protein FtsA